MEPPPNEAILDAIMADLGHARQDELPLNDVSRRGPTFAPGRGTGAGHIPGTKKAALQTAWGTKIVDQESRDLEGLDMGECSWHPQTRPSYTQVPHSTYQASNSNINRNAGRRPSHEILNHLGLNPTSRAYKEFNSVLRDNTTSLPMAIASNINARLKRNAASASSSQSTKTAATTPVVGKSTNQPVLRPKSTVVAPAKNPGSNIPAVAANTYAERLRTCHMKAHGPPAGANVPDSIVCYEGKCMVHPHPDDREAAFVANFRMVLQWKEGIGSIHLWADSKIPQIRSVTDIKQPSIENGLCLLEVKDEITYHLKLQDEETTKIFAAGIRAMQVAVTGQTPQQQTHATSNNNKESHPSGPTPPKTRPLETQSSQTEPPERKPSEMKPSEMKPAERKLSEMKPAERKPSETKPPARKPSETKHSMPMHSQSEAPEPKRPKTEHEPASKVADHLSTPIPNSHSNPATVATVTQPPLVSGDLVRLWTEETFDHMWTMTGKMAELLTQGGDGSSDDVSKRIEGAIAQKWADHGLLHRSSDTCASLTGVLRSLIHLKVNCRTQEPQKPQQSPQGVPKSMELMMARVKYSSQELENLRGDPGPCPEEITRAEKEYLLPKPGAAPPKKPSVLSQLQNDRTESHTKEKVTQLYQSVKSSAQPRPPPPEERGIFANAWKDTSGTSGSGSLPDTQPSAQPVVQTNTTVKVETPAIKVEKNPSPKVGNLPTKVENPSTKVGVPPIKVESQRVQPAVTAPVPAAPAADPPKKKQRPTLGLGASMYA